MNRIFVGTASFAVALTALSMARADRLPTTATDGFYVGARLDPGVALLGGWDLDVYVFRDRTVSVGPGISIAVLSSSASAPGQQQNFLLSADLLRLKIAPAMTNLRPFVAIGGGFAYVRLDPQTTTVQVDPNNPVVLHYPAAEEFAPIVSLGGGLDWFAGGPIAASVEMIAHYRPVGSARMPDVWIDLAVGIRFGL